MMASKWILHIKKAPIASPRSIRANLTAHQDSIDGTLAKQQTPSPMPPPTSPSIASSCCVYQPLPEEVAHQANGSIAKSAANYKNVPPGGMLYDNAPLAAQR